MNGWWQYALVYVLVAWSFWRLLNKYAPGRMWQLQAKISYFFETRKAAPMKRFGRSLRPAPTIPQGCNTHCSKCRQCS
jgi:hypothetical protein